MATNIGLVIQAIKDAEIAKNTIKNDKGVITFTDTKIHLGIGTTTIDYLTLLKDSIQTIIDNTKTEINTKIDNLTITGAETIVYNGTKTTDEIKADRENLKNSLVFNTTTNKLLYIKKVQTDNDYSLEIPIDKTIEVKYGERYVAGANITITDLYDGTKEISCNANTFTGFNIVNSLPTNDDLTDAANANKVYFVI